MEATFSRYGYNSKNQIIVDTLFNAGAPPGEGIEFGGILFSPRIISTLTYDNQGRIIKEVKKWISSAGFTYETLNYAYDSRGNLVVDGWDQAWYDDKVSYLRSHPVFTFLTRNYSKNNPLKPGTPARKYNSKKLPYSVIPGNDYFFTAYYGVSSFKYDCK